MRTGDFVWGDQPDAVFGIHQHNGWLVVAGVGFRDVAEGGDDNNVSRVDQMGGGSIDADHAAASGSLHRVGRQAGSPGHIPDMDLLEREDVGGFQSLNSLISSH